MQERISHNGRRAIPLAEINRAAKEPSAFVAACEAAYARQIDAVTAGIAADFAKKPVVLLSGPSGSSKTSTALQLKAGLAARGIGSLIIHMDDYFVPGALEPDADGKIDYEKPERVDIDLLSEHLGTLACGGSVRLPKFNFLDNTRSFGDTIARDRHTAVIIEGIHALNPMVTGGHHDYATFLYVSVRTRIAAEDGTLLHPSLIRLLRRLVRDRRTRGRDFATTAENFASVQRGEDLYIMPYKQLADYDIDSFFAYELCLYRRLLHELCPAAPLFHHGSSTPDSDEQGLEEALAIVDEGDTLRRFLMQAEELSPALVPARSVLKEFIG